MLVTHHSQLNYILVANSILMFLTIYSATWNTTYITLLNMIHRRTQSVLLSLLTLISSLLFSTCFTYTLAIPSSWFAGQALGLTLTALCAKFLFVDKNLGKISTISNTSHILDKDTLSRYCLPISLVNISLWYQTNGYRLFIERFWGLSELGLISAALQVSSQVWGFIDSIANQLLYPYFFSRLKNQTSSTEIDSAIIDLINVLLPLYLICLGLIVASSDLILLVLTSGAYRTASSILVLGSTLEFFRVLSNILSLKAHMKRNAKLLLIPYSIPTLVSCLLLVGCGQMKISLNISLYSILVGSFLAVLLSLKMYPHLLSRLDSRRLLLGFSSMLLLFACRFLFFHLLHFNSNIVYLVLIALISIFSFLNIMKDNSHLLRLRQSSLPLTNL